MINWLTYGLGWQWLALGAAGLLVAVATPAVRVLGLSAGLRGVAAIGAIMALLLHGRKQRQQGWKDAQKQGKRNAEHAIDKAQRLAERFTAAGIARVRQRLDVQGPDECEDCGEMIEPRRRIALPSATRCVECQGAHERDARMRGR